MSETTERMCSAGGRRLPMRFVELHDAAMKAFHAQLERRGPTSEQAELAYLHAIADLWDEVTALRAALATATARAEKAEAEVTRLREENAHQRDLVRIWSDRESERAVALDRVTTENRDLTQRLRWTQILLDVETSLTCKLKARLDSTAAEREAAALAMREAAAKACESRASSLMQQTRDGVMRVSESNEASKCASAIRCLPTPTSALDAERERVVRWCWQEWAGGMRYDFDAESEIARALAAAKGGQDA